MLVCANGVIRVNVKHKRTPFGFFDRAQKYPNKLVKMREGFAALFVDLK